MNPRIDNWITIQRRMTDQDGISVRKVVLVGPENDAWGTWAIDQEELPKLIDDVIAVQGDEQPIGVYRCKLIGLDGSGTQVAMMPVRVTGRQSAAIGSSTDPAALQRATAVAVSTLQQVIQIQAHQLEKRAEENDSLTEDRTILLEEHLSRETQNFELETKRLEHLQQQEFQREIFGVFKSLAPAVLEPLLGSIAEKIALEMQIKNLESEQKLSKLRLHAAPLPPGYPGAAPPEPLRGEAADSPAPGPGSPGQPVVPPTTPGNPDKQPVVPPATPTSQAGASGVPGTVPPADSQPASVPAPPPATLDSSPDGSRPDQPRDRVRAPRAASPEGSAPDGSRGVPRVDRSGARSRGTKAPKARR